MLKITKKIFSILNKRQKRLAVAIVFLMILGGAMESVSISLILPLISAVMDKDNWNTAWYASFLCDTFGLRSQRAYIMALLLLLAMAFLLKNGYLLLEYYIQYTFIARSRYHMQSNLMHSYIRKPYRFFVNTNSGEVIRILTSDTNQAFTLLTNVLTFYTEIIVSVILGVTVLAMSTDIAVGLVALLGMELVLIALILKPLMKHYGKVQREENSLAYKWILQSVNGIKSIKVARTEGFFEENYCLHARKVVDTERKNQTLSNLPRLIIEAFTMAGILMMLFVMVAGGKSLSSIIPQLSAFAVAAVRLLPSVNRVSTAMNQIPFLEGGLDNVIQALWQEGLGREGIGCERTDKEGVGHERMSQEGQNAGGLHTALKRTGGQIGMQNSGMQNSGQAPKSGQAKRPGRFHGSLVFDHISFSYQDNGKKIFDKASFTIYPGQSVGIVGTSGAGKTTAIDLILGLLKPQEGHIIIDGRDIEADMPAWLSYVAYIPQTIFLMDDSIRANVAFGQEEAGVTDGQVWAALREAQMEEFVRSLPDGLDTQVGEQGIRLSGGQRQRIGIARALYANPDILFLDEATSSLDNDTENAIMDSVSHLKGQKTLVIIAHRLSTIENCDVVYRVENGKIVEES